MIAKIFPKSAGSFKNRIRYIFGCTKHDHAISEIRTISLNCLSKDPLPGINGGNEKDVLEMIAEFDQVEAMRRMSVDSDRPIKPVFHAMLSLRPGEHLTDAQWAQAVQIYMRDLGFSEDNKYVAVMHRDTDHEHVHIVANRIHLDEDFRLVSDSNERSTSMDSASDLEDLFALSKAPRPTETWGTTFSHAELKAATHENDIPHKARMIAKIAGAIEQTRDEDGDMFTLVRHLRRQQVYIHLTKNEEGQPKGIAYEFNGKVISGRKLKRSRLTFHKLITQEGINYDPETISELEIEIARRDPDDQNGVAERFVYVRFFSKSRRFNVKFEPKSKSEREIDAMIEAIQRFLSALFGIPFESKKEKERRESEYIEYFPTIQLSRAMFGIRDRTPSENTLDL
ncbi:relaxase/mobilization nuclease domain-containing protein [Pseudomonas juntendi]|uniref:relaxase/mobilization nuclease domain-containing protein n=1 Tax=Pseudomonas juntendi TaxID=2666183 RepID=UPI0018D93B25|nr:relaxase/mobilization nuclease domain-containing protein [Pseudomonas juntendi]MBH3384683.1 relaxase/mobilization nuclease domain-containing protein [Pseudomonas juntendi]MDG9917852.1 relaxase/mobilization nuclease domain-containing protein [Pseudomonas juntendi]MDH0506311.1 relaxase/mobilization nuclease domain-containing protein [Pseudomonas juntendi]MDH1044567.1 relaxase/mobilization nuclease domain-containing protein [Pseudomonas juntendi]